MSKPINSQPIQKNCNNNISTSTTMCSTTIQNAPLQIQPKPTVTFLQTTNQSRIIPSQPAFAIQSNNQYLANIQPNYSHSNVTRPQGYNMPNGNSFTFTLAPIAAKPIENSNTTHVPGIPSNFQPIQMRPSNSNASKQPPVTIPQSSANISSAAAGGYYREWILEAIDKLRERKARPDAERISTLMKRYHNIPLEDTVMCLNKLADSGAVVCVDYKGNISYRNPYKWRKNSANGGGIMNPPSITNRILESFRHMEKTRSADSQNPHKVGYSINEIEQAILATQTSGSIELSKTQLRHCLEREAAYGKLMRRADCTYVIDENGEKKIRKAATIQAKKTAFSHKPIPNKSIAVAPQPISISTAAQVLPNISNNPIVSNNSFATFSIQQIQSYNPQISQFLPQNERQILPMLTTNSPFTTISLTSVSQPNPILPKQTPPPVAFVKCEASLTPEINPMPALPIVVTKSTNNSCNADNEIKEEQFSSTISSTMQSISSSVITTPTMGTTRNTEMKTVTKTSRRGRPPGSKNKRYQESENNFSTKKQKIDLENLATNVSAPSSCSALSVSNSDQTVPAVGTVIELCSECKSPQTDYEKFLFCKDCNVKVHPSCLHYWPELTERARQSPWQCSSCKTCCVCKDRSSKESVYICDGCDKGFHSACHDPKIQEPISRNAAWICSNCYKEGFRVRSEESMKNSSESLTNNNNKAHKENLPEKSENKNSNEKPNVEIKKENCINGTEEKIRKEGAAAAKSSRPDDITKWSTDDVCDWLTEEGFGVQSGLFREQEIDGGSLLLMKRIDVLTELNLKLGPAVKIYEKIKKIQNDGSIWKYDDCF